MQAAEANRHLAEFLIKNGNQKPGGPHFNPQQNEVNTGKVLKLKLNI